MYKHAKSCIKGDPDLGYFPCSAGVRQGENLSPMLFAMYLCDVESSLKTKYRGLPTLRDVLSQAGNQLNVDLYENLFTLLYADDTLLFAESMQDLQIALYGLDSYCKSKKLVINKTKTKVVVFSRGKIRNKPQFYLNGEYLETVDSQMYLGIMFNYNGSFKKAVKYLYDKSSRAMF